jgi:hypothetical protein
MRHRDGREFDGAEDAAGIQWTDTEKVSTAKERLGK